MNLATELTGGWDWLSSAPPCRAQTGCRAAESREFLQEGSTFVQALLQCVSIRGRWAVTEHWGEMNSLCQGWGCACHRPVLLSSHLQQHSVLALGVGCCPALSLEVGGSGLWRHWWDEWVFLIASLPAAGEVWDIFHPSCCCLWPNVLLSAAVVPWGLRKAPLGNSTWIVIFDCNWVTTYWLFSWVKLFRKLCSWKNAASLAYNSPLFPSNRLWFAVVHFPLKSAFCR